MSNGIFTPDDWAIKLYLESEVGLSDEVINRITDEIYDRLDYTPICEQIDQLVAELTTDD